MSILTIMHRLFNIRYSFPIHSLLILLIAISSCRPKEDVVFRQVRNIVVEADTEPTLHAQAVLYNPNKMRMKLRKINVDVFVNGKKAALVDQKLKTEIPAEAEFTVPLEVKLNMKELGLLDTILGVIGGKKYNLQFKGSISITYKGLPIKVPVDYKTEARLKF